MEIDISQKKIRVAAEYKIHLNQKEKYFAKKKLFKFLGEINLFDKSGGNAKYQIKQNQAWFKLSYDLNKHDDNKFEFRTVNFWKSHYECPVGEDLYEIYGHREKKHSIYKNAVQIACWGKESVTWSSGHNYKLIADNDSEIELLICFCLIIDHAESQNDDGDRGILEFDLRNILPQAKKFNPNWKPKE